MKFLSWFFSTTVRHRWGIRMYQKAGWGFRIFNLILTLLIVAAGLGAEFWFCTAIKNETIFGGGFTKFIALLFIGILIVALVYGSIEICGVYASVGIMMASYGVAISAAKRSKWGNIYPGLNEQGVDTGKYKVYDLIVGIFLIVLTLATIAAAIALPFITLFN